MSRLKTKQKTIFSCLVVWGWGWGVGGWGEWHALELQSMFWKQKTLLPFCLTLEPNSSAFPPSQGAPVLAAALYFFISKATEEEFQGASHPSTSASEAQRHNQYSAWKASSGHQGASHPSTSASEAQHHNQYSAWKASSGHQGASHPKTLSGHQGASHPSTSASEAQCHNQYSAWKASSGHQGASHPGTSASQCHNWYSAWKA